MSTNRLGVFVVLTNNIMKMTSGMLRRPVSQKLTDVSEAVPASIIRATAF
jgi:hypothetical protein